MRQHPRYYTALPFHYAGIAIGWIVGWFVAAWIWFYCAMAVQVRSAVANSAKRYVCRSVHENERAPWEKL